MRATCSFRFSISAAARKIIFPRTGAGVSRQAGNADFAAATAALISPREESGDTLVACCRFAGLRRSSVLPDLDSTQAPLIKFLQSGAVAVAVLIASPQSAAWAAPGVRVLTISS